MSLDWDIRNIPNHETLCWEKTDPDGGDGDDNFHLSPTTHTLIFTTIAVGMGKITAENVGEFHARQKVWAQLIGFDPVPLPDLIAHIGLQTNVSMETRAQWLKRIVKRRMDEYATDAWRTQEKMAEKEKVEVAKVDAVDA